MNTVTALPAELVPVAYLERQQRNAQERDKPLIANWYELELGLAQEDPDRVDKAQIGLAMNAMIGAYRDNSFLDGGTASANLAVLALPHFRARAERRIPGEQTSDKYYATLGTLAVHTANALPNNPEEVTMNVRRVVERLGTLCTFATQADAGFHVYASSPREMKGTPRDPHKPYHDVYTLEEFDGGLLKVPIITSGRGDEVYSNDLNEASSLRLPFSRIVDRAKKENGASENLGIRGGLLALGRFLRQDPVEARTKDDVQAITELAIQKHQNYKTAKGASLQRRW